MKRYYILVKEKNSLVWDTLLNNNEDKYGIVKENYKDTTVFWYSLPKVKNEHTRLSKRYPHYRYKIVEEVKK